MTNTFWPDSAAQEQAQEWIDALPGNDWVKLIERYEREDDLAAPLDAAADGAWTAALAAYAANDDAKREFIGAFRREVVDQLENDRDYA